MVFGESTIEPDGIAMDVNNSQPLVKRSTSHVYNRHFCLLCRCFKLSTLFQRINIWLLMMRFLCQFLSSTNCLPLWLIVAKFVLLCLLSSNPRASTDKKVPQTIRASVYTPSPPNGQCPFERTTFQKGLPLPACINMWLLRAVCLLKPRPQRGHRSGQAPLLRGDDEVVEMLVVVVIMIVIVIYMLQLIWIFS